MIEVPETFRAMPRWWTATPSERQWLAGDIPQRALLLERLDPDRSLAHTHVRRRRRADAEIPARLLRALS